ncbi:tRNA (adenosine(37)-N6)-threonylcarbamoyltransferase complex dimerization subunit type 1 TsaB [Dermabacteraceae bacterium P13128]
MILGLDTSGAISVVVCDDDGEKVLAANLDSRSRHHAEVLVPLIDTTLEQAGGTRADVSAVVVGRGPGPFTGLRVGLVTARSIAAVLGVPLHGVCSLDGLALQAAQEALPGKRGRIAVALDARRREVYYRSYEFTADGWRAEGEPAVAKPADVAEQFAGADLRVGRGALAYPDLLAPGAGEELADVAAEWLIRAAFARQPLGGMDTSSSEPLYLREPDAALPTKRKSALGL